MMDKKYKMRNLTWLTLLLLVITACSYQPALDFTMSPEEALESMTKNKYLISSGELASLTQTAENKALLVDLRTPADFNKGHLSGAINIPVPDLLDDESFSLLKNSENIVLYSTTAFESSGAAMLLFQLGLENVKLLNTAYEGFSDTLYLPVTERARYDYALVFQKAIEEHAKEIKAGAGPALNSRPVTLKKRINPAPKPKKKAVEEEEGC